MDICIVLYFHTKKLLKNYLYKNKNLYLINDKKI